MERISIERARYARENATKNMTTSLELAAVDGSGVIMPRARAINNAIAMQIALFRNYFTTCYVFYRLVADCASDSRRIMDIVSSFTSTNHRQTETSRKV